MPKENVVECSDLKTADPEQVVYSYNKEHKEDQIMTIDLGPSSSHIRATGHLDEESGVFTIRLPSRPKKKKTQLHKGDVKIRPIVNLKKTKAHILENWSTYDPKKIVLVFLKYYKNLRSCAVMLSRFKKN